MILMGFYATKKLRLQLPKSTLFTIQYTYIILKATIFLGRLSIGRLSEVVLFYGLHVWNKIDLLTIMC